MVTKEKQRKTPGPRARDYKIFSCSIQLSMNFFPLINVKISFITSKPGLQSFFNFKGGNFAPCLLALNNHFSI